MRSEASFCAFRGVPTFFRACCAAASTGGSLGYDHAGRELTRHLHNLIPDDLGFEEWESECKSLCTLIQKRDDDAVEQWFVSRYPRCLALVPKRRRAAFLQGVYWMANQQREVI
jgi:hypothetical protein